MGFFGGLDAEGYDREYTDRELVGRIWDYFRPHRGRVALLALLIAIIALAGAAQPYAVSRGLDLLQQSRQLSIVLGVAGAVLVFGIFNWAGNWLRRRITGRLIGDIIVAMRNDAFSASMQHPCSGGSRQSAKNSKNCGTTTALGHSRNALWNLRAALVMHPCRKHAHAAFHLNINSVTSHRCLSSNDNLSSLRIPPSIRNCFSSISSTSPLALPACILYCTIQRSITPNS